MILCLASSNWLTAEKFRQGLWEQCVDEGAKQPLPFELKVKPGCYPARRVGKKVDYFFKPNSNKGDYSIHFYLYF